jgi:hypothetical protein
MKHHYWPNKRQKKFGDFLGVLKHFKIVLGQVSTKAASMLHTRILSTQHVSQLLHKLLRKESCHVVRENQSKFECLLLTKLVFCTEPSIRMFRPTGCCRPSSLSSLMPALCHEQRNEL